MKWFLAIPHYFVLAFLWPAFLVVTVIAGFCILFTGRYPRPLFDFTSGVLRWTWRVSYYAASGGLGTDQYPPFTLGHAPQLPGHPGHRLPDNAFPGPGAGQMVAAGHPALPDHRAARHQLVGLDTRRRAVRVRPGRQWRPASDCSW